MCVVSDEQQSLGKPPRTFTPKQKAFVQAYLRLGNATAAARVAGYKTNNASLRAIAYQNLRKPHIRSFIDQVNAAFFREAQRRMMARLP